MFFKLKDKKYSLLLLFLYLILLIIIIYFSIKINNKSLFNDSKIIIPLDIKKIPSSHSSQLTATQLTKQKSNINNKLNEYKKNLIEIINGIARKPKDNTLNIPWFYDRALNIEDINITEKVKINILLQRNQFLRDRYYIILFFENPIHINIPQIKQKNLGMIKGILYFSKRGVAMISGTNDNYFFYKEDDYYEENKKHLDLWNDLIKDVLQNDTIYPDFQSADNFDLTKETLSKLKLQKQQNQLFKYSLYKGNKEYWEQGF